MLMILPLLLNWLPSKLVLSCFAIINFFPFLSYLVLIYSSCNGVDLNCGCPQRWAIQEGYGACLINKPEMLRDVVLQTRNRIPANDFTVSIKIRIHPDMRSELFFLLFQSMRFLF